MAGKLLYFLLLRGLFKIAYLFREQKFFIRLYKDRAFLLSASMVFLWFRLYAIFHAISKSVSKYSSLLLISHSNKRCKSLHFLAASYSTDCICLVVDALETKQYKEKQNQMKLPNLRNQNPILFYLSSSAIFFLLSIYIPPFFVF